VSRRHPFPLVEAFILFVWMTYLVADTFVTANVRVPIPPLLATSLLFLTPNSGKWSLGALIQPPRWAYPLMAIFAFGALKEPAANALFLLILLTTIIVFRVRAADAASYGRLCKAFYGVLMASSFVLFFSYAFPALGLGLRVFLFGAGVLERPYPAGFSQLVHIYGYQVAALGGIALAMSTGIMIREGRATLRGFLVFAHAAAVLLLGMQRSAVLGVIVAFLLLVRRYRPGAILRYAGALIVAGLLVVLLGPGLSLLEDTIIGKEQQDTKRSMRFELQVETLEIIKAHPWGLIIEGREWDQGLFRWGGVLSRSGLSGHNAYLMAIAFMGVPAIGLLLAVLVPVIRVALVEALPDMNSPAGYWPPAMALALVALLVNAVLHNASLFSGQGATIFAYVAVWHWHDLQESGGQQA